MSALGYALRFVGKNVTYALGYALRHVQHFCKEVCAGGYALTQEKTKTKRNKNKNNKHKKQKTPPEGGRIEN